MESKKNPNADLEKYRGLFFLIGLLFTLGLVYLILNYESAEPIKEEINIEITGFEVNNCK